jgi:hypothetical protein
MIVLQWFICESFLFSCRSYQCTQSEIDLDAEEEQSACSCAFLWHVWKGHPVTIERHSIASLYKSTQSLFNFASLNYMAFKQFLSVYLLQMPVVLTCRNMRLQWSQSTAIPPRWTTSNRCHFTKSNHSIFCIEKSRYCSLLILSRILFSSARSCMPSVIAKGISNQHKSIWEEEMYVIYLIMMPCFFVVGSWRLDFTCTYVSWWSVCWHLFDLVLRQHYIPVQLQYPRTAIIRRNYNLSRAGCVLLRF